MKKSAILVAVVCVFMAAGCVTGSVNSDGTMSSSAFGTSLGELTNVRDRTVRTTVYERNADKDAEAEREIRRNRATAEDEVIRGQAQILQAYAERLNPAGGKRLEELLQLRKELYTAWVSESDLETRLSLWDEIQETRQQIYEFLHETGAPASYYGGMGGLPSVMSIGGMPMPGMGMPVGGVLQRDHTRGRIVNETDGMIYVTVEGTEVQIRPQDAVAMILPPGSYRYTAQKITGTAIGPIASVTIGGDLRVDDRWEEDIHQGWELRFRPWAFPR